MSSDMISKDEEMSRLLVENRSLSEELAQCQNDKEFVWSLWKKLQVANPDVSQAISLVLQREKEKSEMKDRKVLEILQLKDEKIEELQSLMASRQLELSDLAVRRGNFQEEITELQMEINSLKDRNTSLELQVKSYENRDDAVESIHRKAFEDSELTKRELEQQLRSSTTELDRQRVENAENLALRLNLENKVRMLERDVTSKVGQFEGMIGEMDQAKTVLQQYATQVGQSQREVEFKNQELETVRKELSELWGSHNQLTDHSSQQAELIRQLQSLQQDTQKMLKNQEDAYSMETTSIQQMYADLTARYDQSKKSESEYRQQIMNLKRDLLDKDDVISDLQSRLDTTRRGLRSVSTPLNGSYLAEKEEEVVEPVIDLKFKVESLQRQVESLKDGLSERDRMIERLQNERENSIEFDVSHLHHRERTHSTPARELRSIGLSPIRFASSLSESRSRSTSPVKGGGREFQRQLVAMERKVEDVHNMLKLKTRELDELKKAHAKRFERLKLVQTDNKVLKDQVKHFEEGSKKRKNIRRSDPKDLRREDSDAVWNELAYFKNENRSLAVEKMALEEENDTLRVQASQDAATLHELRVALEQEKEEREYESKKSQREIQGQANYESELNLLKSEIENKNVLISKMEREVRESKGERDALHAEKSIATGVHRSLKAEILQLKEDESRHRMETADLKRDIQRLQRELSEEQSIKQNTAPRPVRTGVKPGNRANKRGGKTVAHQYQKALNRSIEKMQTVFSNFNDEGWEEITESADEEEETEVTESDSLGRAIVTASQSQSQPQCDTTDAVSSPSSTSLQKSKNKKYQRSSTRTRRAAVRNLHRVPRLNVNTSPTDTEPTSSSSDHAGLARRVVMREIGTSPIGSPVREKSPPDVIRQPSPITRQTQSQSLVRQLKPMKQRVGYLQQQVTTLRDSRAGLTKSLNEQKESNQHLQSDLNMANQRLRLARQGIQRLTTEQEKLLIEKSNLEAQVSTARSESSTTVASVDRHTEQDWKVMEARLKASSGELSRQSATLRQVKLDNEGYQEQVRNLQDRINRLERDNSQKRTLLEDQRTRLKLAQENQKTDANIVEDLETKVKLLAEANDKNKTQIESLKKRLSVVTREKRDYEQRFLKLTNELDRKTKQLSDVHSKKLDLEGALSELEKTAQQQLEGLAFQSEAAIDAAQEKLASAHNYAHQYQQFVKMLGQKLIQQVQQTRSHVRDVQGKSVSTPHADSSLKKAQSVARDILNLSQTDLEDIMSATGETYNLDSDVETEKRRDRKWIKKCERFLNSKEESVAPLVELFVKKMEERHDLISQLLQS